MIDHDHGNEHSTPSVRPEPLAQALDPYIEATGGLAGAMRTLLTGLSRGAR